MQSIYYKNGFKIDDENQGLFFCLFGRKIIEIKCKNEIIYCTANLNRDNERSIYSINKTIN